MVPARRPATAILLKARPALSAQIVQNIFMSEKSGWLREQVLTYYDQNGTGPRARNDRKRSSWLRPRTSRARASGRSRSGRLPQNPPRAAPSDRRKATGLRRISKRLARKALSGGATRPCPRRWPPPKRKPRRRPRRQSHRLHRSARPNGVSRAKPRPPPVP